MRNLKKNGKYSKKKFDRTGSKPSKDDDIREAQVRELAEERRKLAEEKRKLAEDRQKEAERKEEQLKIQKLKEKELPNVRESKSRVEVVDSDNIRQDERAKRKELLELKNKVC